VQKTERIELRLEPHLVEALDEWRRQQKDLPNRSEALRRMVTAATDPLLKKARK